MIIVLLLFFRSLCLFCQRLVLHIYDRWIHPRNVRLLTEAAESNPAVANNTHNSHSNHNNGNSTSTARTKKRYTTVASADGTSRLLPETETCRFCANTPQGYCRHHLHLQELQLQQQQLKHKSCWNPLNANAANSSTTEYRQLRKINRELRRNLKNRFYVNDQQHRTTAAHYQQYKSNNNNNNISNNFEAFNYQSSSTNSADVDADVDVDSNQTIDTSTIDSGYQSIHTTTTTTTNTATCSASSTYASLSEHTPLLQDDATTTPTTVTADAITTQNTTTTTETTETITKDFSTLPSPYSADSFHTRNASRSRNFANTSYTISTTHL